MVFTEFEQWPNPAICMPLCKWMNNLEERALSPFMTSPSLLCDVMVWLEVRSAAKLTACLAGFVLICLRVPSIKPTASGCSPCPWSLPPVWWVLQTCCKHSLCCLSSFYWLCSRNASGPSGEDIMPSGVSKEQSNEIDSAICHLKKKKLPQFPNNARTTLTWLARRRVVPRVQHRRHGF